MLCCLFRLKRSSFLTRCDLDVYPHLYCSSYLIGPHSSMCSCMVRCSACWRSWRTRRDNVLFWTMLSFSCLILSTRCIITHHFARQLSIVCYHPACSLCGGARQVLRERVRVRPHLSLRQGTTEPRKRVSLIVAGELPCAFVLGVVVLTIVYIHLVLEPRKSQSRRRLSLDMIEMQPARTLSYALVAPKRCRSVPPHLWKYRVVLSLLSSRSSNSRRI